MKIYYYLEKGQLKWCFGTTVKTLTTNISELDENVNFLLLTNENFHKIKTYPFDLIWLRGQSCKQMPKEFSPTAARKTIRSITTGSELLYKRIDVCDNEQRILIGQTPPAAFFTQNKETAARVKYKLKDLNIDKYTQVFTLPNAVNTEIFKPQTKPKRFIVGYAGRILEDYNNITKREKSLEINPTFTKGFHLVKMACDILGYELKICSREKYFIPHEEMPDWYNSISCFVLPSITDACSNAMLEAQASEVPVITTKLSYHGEECTDMENIIFTQRTVLDICDRLKWVHDNYEKAKEIGKNGRKFVLENNNIDLISQKYLDAFKACSQNV